MREFPEDDGMVYGLSVLFRLRGASMAILPVSLLLAFLLGACGPAAGRAAAVLPGGPPPAEDSPPPEASPPPPPPLAPVPLDVRITDLTVEPGPESGSVVLRFTTPGSAGDAAPDAYVVRVSRRHLTADDLDHAQVVAVSHTPGVPGTAEAVTVRNLEPGRTLQFGVQAVRGDETGPFGYAAGGRVAGADLPAVPASAIRLDGPATLSKPGATYLLTRDITTTGSGFRITAPDVTLDLGDHSVTYGTGTGRSYGVVAEWPGTSGRITVRNGTLVQASTQATYGHGILLRGVGDVRVSYLAVTVRGPDASGIQVTEADDVRVDHCSVACLTQVVSNRHYPGVSAIFVEQATGSLEIDQNLVTASPQWGIRVEGRSSQGDVLVHHNRVLGTKALVANGYMLALHKPDAEAYENLLRGESRGIHIDEVDASGRNVWIHDNDVHVQDQPNPEYPGHHWAHGIKIEGASGCRVEHNRVGGVADPGHGDVHALDVDVGKARGIIVRYNVFEAISVTPALKGHALHWTNGAEQTPGDTFLEGNVFTATDTLVFRDWDGGGGGSFHGNWWLRDLSQGAGRPFCFEYFFNGDSIASRGHRFLDPYPPAMALDVEQRSNAGSYDSTREWTLTVAVRDGTTPVAGAEVTVRNRAGEAVLTTTTDARGLSTGTVLSTLVTSGPTFANAGPFGITVDASGHARWEGVQEITAPTALVVDLAKPAASLDATDPGAPEEVRAHMLSASRAFLCWTPAEDDVAVVRYLVYLDGKPAGITEQEGILLGGLEASMRYVPSVRALDAAGRLSPIATGAAFTTRPEDRGP